MDSLDLGDLRFRVRWSARRKTLGLTVERDGSLTLAAPAACPEDRLIAFAKSKTFWVYTQLAKRDLLHRSHPVKEFTNGEGFPYLGRNYRLLLVDPDDGDPIRLLEGRLQMHRGRASEGAELLQEWYTRLGRLWLRNRVRRLANQAGAGQPAIQVQDLGFRWGSCGRNGRLYFHWKVMTLPPSLVEYIVAHELTHLREPHHTPAFWRILGHLLPDFEVRRDTLARMGGDL